MKIFGEFAVAQRADVGIGPYSEEQEGSPMYETTRQRVCKWLLLAVLVFSTLDAALFALFDIGMERIGLRCLNSFFEYYLPELFPGKLTVYVAAFAGAASLVGWILLLCGKRAGITVIFAVSVLPFFKSILIFVTSVLALFSAADFGAQALAFAKDLVTFVTAGLPIVLMLFWKGRGY